MIKARRICTARKEYRCTERSYHTIRPGDRYLYDVCPPWHDVNNSGKWWVVRSCLRCAKEFGLLCSETLKQLEAGKGCDA